MPNSVIFNEEEPLGTLVAPTPQKAGLTRSIMRAGFAGSMGDASILLAVGAAVMIGISFFILASAIQEPPQLGNDVLRSDEVVPDYVPR